MVDYRKKVGIVTFHRSHNCGSILQSYAMQHTLTTYGYTPEFIDLSTKGQREIYSVLKPLDFSSLVGLTKSLYRNFIDGILFNRTSHNWRSYDSYIAKYLSISSKSYMDSSEIKELELDYDLYLTGSDQVWNVSIADYDDAYFLNFVHSHPKIAYAVSQGAKDISKYSAKPEKIAEYIKDIDFVSTREENGRKWLKNLTGNEYPVVLDPTLLHEEQTYTHIEEAHEVPGVETGEYIFVYATPLSRAFMRSIRQYAKQNNLKIVIWHSNVWLKRFGWLTGIKCPKNQNPGKYLDLIKNAKFICTSSFHGVAFSTIYRKDFVVLENEGMRAGDDDRMTGFLKRLNLFDRIVNLSQFNQKMNEPVEYSAFKKELKKQQEISRRFLINALGVERK